MLSLLRAKPLDSIWPYIAARRPTWARTSIWPLLILLSGFGTTDAFAAAQGTSSAYAVDVNVTLLGQPNATQEGPLPTSNSGGPTTGTSASSTAPGILDTGVLNTSSTASGGGDTATASSANVNMPLLSGIGTVQAASIQASCTATSSGINGNTTLTNATLGSLGALAVNPAANTTIQINLPVIGKIATLILNEQILNADGSRTVNAWHLHLTGSGAVGTIGSGDVIVSSVTCGAAVPPPTVIGLSPTSGTSIGGTSVTITGTGFTGATTVKFGATNATSFTVSSDTSISATAPPGTGTVDVTVTTPAGTSATSTADQYTYIVFAPPTATAAFSPSTIDVGQTSQLTITVANPNAAALTSVQFSDVLPSGITLVAQTAGTCGTVPSTGGGAVNINTASGSFSVTSNTLAANSSCNVTMSVRANIAGIAVDSTTSISSGNASAGGGATATLTINPAVTATQIIPSEALIYNTTAANFTPVTGGGGTGVLTYGIAPPLPTGLTLNPATGTISGAPTATSSATTYIVTVTDTLNASASNTFTLSVAQATPVLNWTAPTPITYGTALGSTQLNATASYNGNPVAGTFIYTPTAGTLLSAGSNQALSTTFTPSDATHYVGATASTTITVNAASTVTTLVSNPSAPVYGQSTTLSATVSLPAGSNGTTAGAVAFNEGASALAGCGAVPVSGGSAQCPIASLPVGSHAIVAMYTPSNSNTITSTSNAASVTVNKAATTTAITAPAPITLGNSVSVSASVAVTSPGAGTPTGTIAISDGGSGAGDSCTISLPATNCMLSPSSGGVKPLSASYAGDSSFAASTAPSTNLTVNPAQAGTSVSSSANPSTFGQSVTFTATVTPTAGNPTPTGIVSFTDTTTNSSLCTNATLVAGSGNAMATCAASALAVGVHTIQANYGGDANNQPSNGTFTQTVNKDTTSMTLTASPNPAGLGQTVTLTATVYGDPPTGSVTFYESTSQLGTGVLAATSSTSSVATFSISTLTPGTHNMSATYVGDGNNQATASAVVAVAVNTPPVAAPMLDRWAMLLLVGMMGGCVFWQWRRAKMPI